jgi:hypothetical protein
MKLRFIGIALMVAALLWVWSFNSYLIPQSQPSVAEAVLHRNLAALNVDLKHLPIGDGKVSTHPEVGSVWPCRTHFNSMAGAHASGDWIHSDGTYDLTAKPTVDGAVLWPSQFKIKLQNNIPFWAIGCQSLPRETFLSRLKMMHIPTIAIPTRLPVKNTNSTYPPCRKLPKRHPACPWER